MGVRRRLIAEGGLGGRAAFEVFDDGVADAGDAAYDCREKQGIVAKFLETKRADEAACEKPQEEDAVDAEAKPVDGGAAQEVAAGDAEIRDHAGDVGRAHRGPAVSGDHRILEAAGHRSEEVADVGTATQKINRKQERGGFE